MSDLVPVPAAESELKEKLICHYYFGGVNINPKDFINRNLDTALIEQISSNPDLSLDTARSLVLNYIANYCSWVQMTRTHHQKTELAVSLLPFNN